MKRTLKRELKVLEIAKREALTTSHMLCQSLFALCAVRVVVRKPAVAYSRMARVVYDAASVKINSDGGRRCGGR